MGVAKISSLFMCNNVYESRRTGYQYKKKEYIGIPLTELLFDLKGRKNVWTLNLLKFGVTHPEGPSSATGEDDGMKIRPRVRL